MEIYRDSWHYRYVAKPMWKKFPASLCWYFWKVVLTIPVMMIWAVVVGTVLAFGIYALILPFAQWFGYFDYRPVDHIISFAMWIFIGVMAYMIYRDILIYDGRITPAQKKPPGLVSQYVHAKHRRICPLIKYVDKP